VTVTNSTVVSMQTDSARLWCLAVMGSGRSSKAIKAVDNKVHILVRDIVY
jgi:hypothetical protein